MPRRLEHDWYPGVIPDNVVVEGEGYLESSLSFERYRSREPVGVSIANGAAAYLPTSFDLGVKGSVWLGECAMLNGPRILCDGAVGIGAYCLVSWNVVMMDTYRVPVDPASRRAELERVSKLPAGERFLDAGGPPRPITVGDNVWVGFDAVVLPGVTIGEGSVVGARSVVNQDVPAYSIAVGNPARVVKSIKP